MHTHEGKGYVAFHQCFHCLPTYLFMAFSRKKKVNWWRNMLHQIKAKNILI